MKKIVLTLLVLVCCSSIIAAEDQPGLVEGIQAPDFEAVNYQGETVQLSDFYREGPVVLIFYRGGWCYYCNLQLQALQKRLKDFEQLGASIVALSVDRVENAAKTVTEKKLGFEVVSNPDAKILEAYNLIYQVPEDLVETYKNQYKIDLQAASGRTDRVIAIPAVYVIDQSGTIVFAYANEDYTIRKSPQEILDVLKTLR